MLSSSIHINVNVFDNGIVYADVDAPRMKGQETLAAVSSAVPKEGGGHSSLSVRVVILIHSYDHKRAWCS